MYFYSLPKEMDDLVTAANAPNTVVVNQSGTPVTLLWHTLYSKRFTAVMNSVTGSLMLYSAK